MWSLYNKNNTSFSYSDLSDSTTEIYLFFWDSFLLFTKIIYKVKICLGSGITGLNGNFTNNIVFPIH